jgi:hypothetical protein
MTTTDPESDIAAITVGSGILLTQAFALFPGLFPCLLLLLPFVLPLIVLAPIVAIPYGLWKLGSTVLVGNSSAASRRLDTPDGRRSLAGLVVRLRSRHPSAAPSRIGS